MSDVTEFSEVFAEAMTDYGFESIYGCADDEDNDFYKYALFQDFIFELVIGLKACDLHWQLNTILDSNTASKEMDRTESEMKSMLYNYVVEKLPVDEELIEATSMEVCLPDILSRCLDRMDVIRL